MSNTTRRAGSGAGPIKGEGETAPPRLNARVLRPSQAAIELARLLGKCDGFLDRVRSAGQSFAWTQRDLSSEQAADLAKLRSLRGVPPAWREEQISAFLKRAKAAAKVEHQKARAGVADWVAAVMTFARHRQWLREATNLDLQKVARTIESQDGEALQKLEQMRRAYAKARQLGGLAELRRMQAEDELWHAWQRTRGNRGRERYATEYELQPEKAIEQRMQAIEKFWRRMFESEPELIDLDPKTLQREVLRGHKRTRPDKRSTQVTNPVPRKENQ